METAQPGQAPPPTPVRLLVVAGVLGIVVTIAAVAFTSILHAAEGVIWTDLPELAGWAEPPWWYVLALPALGGVLVAGARALPGHGGHGPLDGLGLEPPKPIEVPGVLLACFGSLAFGLVLGPEAPLLAIGLALGMVTARLLRLEEGPAKVILLAGAAAALSTVFAGPLPTLLLMFELVVAGGLVATPMVIPVLLPGFVAMGVGALALTGIAGWPGVHAMSFEQLALPAYPTVRILDLAWTVVVAAVAAGVVSLTRDLAGAIAVRAKRHTIASLIVGGLAVGGLAVLFHELTGRSAQLVLFSGQTALQDVVTEGAVLALAVLLVAKALAFAISLAVGFRGGPVFPAVILGMMVGAAFALVLPGFGTTPAIVAGLAAGAAASMRLPFFGAVLAALLVGLTATGTAPIAVIAAVTGWRVALALDRTPTGRDGSHEAPPAAAPS